MGFFCVIRTVSQLMSLTVTILTGAVADVGRGLLLSMMSSLSVSLCEWTLVSYVDLHVLSTHRVGLVFIVALNDISYICPHPRLSYSLLQHSTSPTVLVHQASVGAIL